MGVYEDMANDAGYAYGTDENQHMAESIHYQEQQRYNEETEQQYYEEIEQDYIETMREERRLEILFREFNWKTS